MSQESVIAVREFLDAAIRRDYEVALAAIHPEVEWHSPLDVPNPEAARGRDEYVAIWRDWVDAWDDYRWTPDEFLEARAKRSSCPVSSPREGETAVSMSCPGG